MSELDSTTLANLDVTTRKEIAEWMESETAKSKVQTSIHTFTDMCFKKCVTKINSSSLDGAEESCLSNCINRFLDTNINVIKMIQSQSQR